MKIPFLLVLVSAAFATNASDGENPYAIKNATEEEPFIYNRFCNLL